MGVWNDRDRILLTQRTHNRLVQWGFQARDIPKLFKMFDHNKDGELDIAEFRDMVQEMGLGLKKSRVVELFELFDDDGSGGVDAKEFVKTLFPNDFHDIYEKRASNASSNAGSMMLSTPTTESSFGKSWTPPISPS